MEFILLSILVVLIQLSDSYLRYLPFSSRTTIIEIHRLWIRLLIWSIVAISFYYLIFNYSGINTVSYKSILMIGWIPYCLISILTIKHQSLQHIFIIGMSLLWVIIQNNWAAMIDVIFFIDETDESIIFAHSVSYLLLFIIMLPVERHYFMHILPQNSFWDSRPQGYYIVLLPIIIGAGHFILWADGQLIHSWPERFSRLYLIFAFFFIYKYVLTGANTFYEHGKTLRKMQLLKEQVSSLECSNKLMKNNHQQITLLRNSLHNNYQMLLKLINENAIDKVQNYIHQQECLLNSTKIISFCREPLINAALSIYLQQAEEFNIIVHHKINLPINFSTNESDFAILISNLLENAINASQKQSSDSREISIIVQHSGKQCVLEISNRYDYDFIVGENGLPKTHKEGHGIGMVSLEAFVNKYRAQVEFLKSDGWVKFSMYWEDSFVC
ncbi:MAG: GHKL domain-containing protein [Selenomonadaceae bacterium]|nr:GHKL domain-containing protein [Selenomonadaceae bacterium]